LTGAAADRSARSVILAACHLPERFAAEICRVERSPRPRAPT